MRIETSNNRVLWRSIALLPMLISGLLMAISLKEFYYVDILAKTADYPFGAEGPTPYYYQTAQLYAKVQLSWGLISFVILVLAIRAVVKGQRKSVFWLLGLTALFILVLFLQGQIESN